MFQSKNEFYFREEKIVGCDHQGFKRNVELSVQIIFSLLTELCESSS